MSRAAHKNSNKRHKIFWQQLRRDTENGEMQRKKKITGRKREQMEAAQRSRNWSKVLLCCCSCCCCWTCNGTANGAATPDAVGLHWQQQFQFQLLLIEIKVYVRRDPPPPPPLCSPSLDKYQMSFAGLCESLAWNWFSLARRLSRTNFTVMMHENWAIWCCFNCWSKWSFAFCTDLRHNVTYA